MFAVKNKYFLIIESIRDLNLRNIKNTINLISFIEIKISKKN